MASNAAQIPGAKFLNSITAIEFYEAAAAAAASPEAIKWEWVGSESTAEGYLLRRNEPWPPGADELTDHIMELHIVYSVAFQAHITGSSLFTHLIDHIC